jgi:uncharacterized protein DUF6010
MLAEAAAERATTHSRLTGDDGQRQVAAQMLVDPDQQRSEGRAWHIGLFVNDELGLPTGTLERHDCCAGDVRRDRRTKIASDEMEAQIESGGPIWPFMRTSSLGCCVFDSLIAMWFLAGAPDLVALNAAPGP